MNKNPLTNAQYIKLRRLLRLARVAYELICDETDLKELRRIENVADKVRQLFDSVENYLQPSAKRA